ncbi:MAG: hypothetical protein HY872_09885 [Chloroflexi bacterium]|nr:hypothetical protein [Chloroflexota bacterium]MBI5830478.1 hypothetical protein [Chloroflexota bacterium]
MLRYRLLDNQAPDYALVYQCGFILRLFANQPTERFMLAETSLGQEHVKRLVLAETAPLLGLTTRQAADLQGQLLAGLLVHLQSVPVGLRIGRWLRQSFAEFHPAQRETYSQCCWM